VVLKERLQKLREDKERLDLELVHGEVIAFPKINVSTQFIEKFRIICKEIFLTGDIKRRQTFLKSFIKKIDLTRDTCKVHYDLARLLVAHEDGSRLREGLEILPGIDLLLAPGLQVVAVNTMKGTAILGSDCGHIFKNYETEIPSCFIVDLVAWMKTYEKVKAKVSSLNLLFPGHDVKMSTDYPKVAEDITRLV